MNNKELLEWTKGKFEVLDKNFTYKQGGSLYNRYCYKLRKKV